MSTQIERDTRTIEPVSRPEEREAALARRKAYPYKFPRDPRKMGGKFTVEENARRLLRWFYFERRLAHGLGSWTLTIPDFEVKIETGRHIFWHMDAAMASLLILQTVVDEGLGACFFGMPGDQVERVREEFGIPPQFDPVGAITVGHPSREPGAKGSPTRRARRDPADVVHRGSWSTPG